MSILQTCKSSFLKLFTVLAISAFALTAAQATPIEGEVLFGGTVTGNTADISSATVLNFDNALVVNALGDPAFDNVSGGDSATFNTLVLDPFVSMTPLWTVLAANSGGTYDWFFDLTNILDIDRSTSETLSVFGTGVLRSSNPDHANSDATFSLSADSSGGTIAFSSTTTTASVPEPTTLGLLGLGLLGMGLARRRRRTAASL